MIIANRALFLFGALAAFAGAAAIAGACASPSDNQSSGGGGDTGGNGDPSGSGGAGGIGGVNFDGGMGGGGGVVEPKTCEQAASSKSNIGCEFYPTIVANGVWSIFDYAVVVANAGEDPATITVARGGAPLATVLVPPNELRKIYLPWINELKGADMSACIESEPLTASVRVSDGAYHLVSDRPVTVYQFNALEYAPTGGPSGKDWSLCPAKECNYQCLSYSNDASLLLPSTALTASYRITAQAGWSNYGMGAYFAVTGTKDNTTVTVKVSAKGAILAGGGIQAAGPNSVFTFPINKGEVVELASPGEADLGGTLVSASAPVQVVTGVPCIESPLGTPSCDHIEESVFPAETLGRHYFVTVPTGPNGDAVGHVVRLYGNVDGTKLTYLGAKPADAPAVINAGQVADLGIVKGNFEIEGDHEFAVGSFMLGSDLVDPLTPQVDQRGDPAQSQSTAVEQYRVKYVFLSPDDYDFSYVDVVRPEGTAVMIDGQLIAAATTPISSGFEVARVKLGPGVEGAHVLTAAAPVGIQVMGYGTATSYYYPGGLDLKTIAPPPPPPK
jgi:hypothetical protein